MTFRFSHRPYRLPFRVAVNTAHGPWAEREGVLVRLETEGGGIGYGEIAPLPWFGTCTVPEAMQILGQMQGSFRLDTLATLPPHQACVRAGLEAAFEAARRDECAERSPDTVPADRAAKLPPGQGTTLRPHVQVAALLPAGPAALERARERADLGFRCMKWKVGVGDLQDELGLLLDLLAVVPEGTRLRLDANGAWDRRRAEKWLARCADLPIEFVEQPIAPGLRGSEDLLLGLAQDYPVPIALDESVVNDSDVERWIELGWNGHYVLKPSLLGDVHGRLAALARCGAPVVFSSALETRVGALRLLRLALAWSGEAHAVGAGVWPLFTEARCDGPAAAPFFRATDLETYNVEDTWNAIN